MRAIVIGIGDELVAGQVTDSNSGYLARQLGARGIETIAHWTIRDDHRQIASAIQAAAAQADLVLISGGLGPTGDDLTRQGLADALGTQLVMDEAQLSTIQGFFRSRGRKMSKVNEVQAMFPKGTEPLDNACGTAPGIVAKIGQVQVFVTPGVPHEMRKMYEAQIAPRLPKGTGVIVHRIVHTFGAGESDVAARIAEIMRRSGPVTVGTTVAAGMVSIRIAAHGAETAQAQQRAAGVICQLRDRLGGLVIGEGEQTTMASVVASLLGERGATLSTAESCTGGLIGEMITAVPGASEYYLGGFVCYCNESKIHLLGVPADLLETEGAVSKSVAAGMASACRQKTGSDWAIGVTGIAGPGGGTDEKPVGLVYISLAGAGGVQTHRHIFSGNRDIIRLRSARAGLNYLRLELM